MTSAVVCRTFGPFITGYSPPGDGPFPAILVLHGSEGGWSGWSHRNAVLLAANGFLAYPFAYSRSGNFWYAGDIVDVPLDQTETAIAELRGNSLSNGRIGLFGVSRGAEHALLLSALMARDGVSGQPEAVAAHSPSDVICGGFEPNVTRPWTDPKQASWDPAKLSWTWRGSADGLMPATPIEIERYAGPLLISHGTEDKVWTVDCTRRLEARLKAAGRDPEIYYYEGENHGLQPDAENQNNTRLLSFFTRHLVG
ncbi:alpha/beta hydrolase family protein [Thalassobaculum salexigens]|uniref:alpha/beta hydrolase family protein n=1 Tax=Thalassobaculum salexigens TaxID=455360 RepID=UPI00248ED6DF|nr:acyl-CoA thioester hydrolase/BAAT C-terminal domain-containing protein [Thalassobaculum salexigens]